MTLDLVISRPLAHIPFGVLYLLAVPLFCLLVRYRTSLFSNPNKSSSGDDANSNSAYSQIFPPSQRWLLSRVKSKDASPSGDEMDMTAASKSLLDLDADYRQADDDELLFSGFTVGEVRDLGDFPDYATLSEVPLPKPFKEFDHRVTPPRPYRPFRWPYHQTMAFQKMEPDYWLELDNTYEEHLQQRLDIFAKYGDGVMQGLPGSELACKEIMEMVIQFLCARYPTKFELNGRNFVNHILGKSYDVVDTPPLSLLMENVPEDFAIMLRDPVTGAYKFQAGIICYSTGWNLAGKIGRGLPAIHDPVPDYKEKLQLSLDRFFTKLPTSKPIQRGTWGFEVGQHLYVHPDSKHPEPEKGTFGKDDIILRVDWQTLRRLPLSGAIVFNFKAFFTPVTEFADELYVPSLALKVIRDSKENLLTYKKVALTEHIVGPLLAEYEKAQVERGVVSKDWAAETLDDNPFFPGWEDKWRRLHAAS